MKYFRDLSETRNTNIYYRFNLQKSSIYIYPYRIYKNIYILFLINYINLNVRMFLHVLCRYEINTIQRFKIDKFLKIKECTLYC